VAQHFTTSRKAMMAESGLATEACRTFDLAEERPAAATVARVSRTTESEMNSFAKILAIAALTASFATPSFAQNMQPAASDTTFAKEFKEANMKMMRDMQIQLSGNPDVDFVRGMIPHHRGAIDMAKIELAHGKDPEMRKMAGNIIKDQEKEIAEMQAWLKKNNM
jgi:uncharacterized protein (DUF305 family)